MQNPTLSRPQAIRRFRDPARFVGHMTPAEYHAFNHEALEKHEFIEGEVVRMAGASVEHTYIHADLLVELALLLRGVPGRPYRVVGSDLKIYIGPNVFFYPDIVIIPTSPQIDQNEAVRNPILVVEILSTSTEDYDRDEKFERYKQIESLRHYLLVEQDMVLVTHYEKNASGVWVLAGTYKNLTDTIPAAFDDAPIAISVGEIYTSISFDE